MKLFLKPPKPAQVNFNQDFPLTPSVMEHVGIPKFDPKNSLHQKLTEISKKCHQLKADLSAEASAQAEGKEKQIEKLEKQNNELVKGLFKIKP